ncbi:MAG: hypothetical protein WA865_21125 [Spirulinaceae cyanobacterium]
MALTLIPTKPANACSPAPDSRPSSLLEKGQRSQYVFAGIVTEVEGNSVVVQVNEYFKGQGPKTVTLTGFNQTSCDDFLSTGERRLFFGEDSGRESWQAVYDGAFGSTETWSEQVEFQVEEIDWQAVSSPNNLPLSVAEAVKNQANQDFGFGNSKIEITSAQKRTWSNGCLGIAFPDLGCTEALVEGWLVEATRGDRNLRYRTDNIGKTVYLENGRQILPNSVQEAILNQALPLLPVNPNKMKLTQAFPRIWDGCLGIYPEKNTPCTKIAIAGWQVIFEEEGGEGEKRWVFHSNQDGSQLKINLAASYLGNLILTQPVPQPQPVPISSNNLPQGAIFRAISSGGFAGTTTEVTLWRNGRVVTKNLTPNNRALLPKVSRVKRKQVQEFQQLLTQQEFSSYNDRNFPPPEGAADFFGITLISQDSSLTYTDINTNELPEPLQTAIAAWQDLLATAKE